MENLLSCFWFFNSILQESIQPLIKVKNGSYQDYTFEKI